MKKIYLLSSGAKIIEDAINNSIFKDKIIIVNPIIDNKIIRFIRKIHFMFPLPLKNLWIKKYNFEKNSVFIVFDTPIWFETINYISKNYSNSEIIFWYWNIVKNKKYLEKIKNITNKIYTFDKKEAKKYKINYHPQFYWLNKSEIQVSKETYDVLFIGRNKGRLKEIEKLYEALEKSGLKLKFYVVKDKKSDTSDIIKLYEKFISYDEVINYVQKSKIILDINQENQSGLTLRVLEALFFDKKLITNNKDIINYDFYNESNILVLKKNNEIKEFIKKKNINIDNKIKQNYDVEIWLKTLLKGVF